MPIDFTPIKSSVDFTPDQSNSSSKTTSTIDFSPDSKGIDFTPEEKVNLVTELPKQFAIGLINSALMNVPLFALEHTQGKQAVDDLTSPDQAGKIARGVGTATGFLVGLPAKVFVRGGVMAGELAAKAIPEAVGAGKAIQELSTAQRLTKGAIEGAGGAALTETLTAPKNEIAEKQVTVPLATALGASFGVAGEAIKPVISRFVSDVTNGNKSMFTNELADNVLTQIDRLKLQKDKILATGDLAKAQEFVNANFTGSLQEKANKEIEALSKFTNKDIIPVTQIPPDSIQSLLDTRKTNLLNNNIFTSARTYLNNQGAYGKELVSRIDEVGSQSEIRAGQAFLDYQRARKGLTPSELSNFVDVSEGRAVPLNNKVQTLFNVWDKYRTGIAQEAANKNLSIKTLQGDVNEFVPRNDYFPHIVINEDAPNKIVGEVLNAAVKRGDFEDLNTAKQTWDSYKSYIQTGARSEKILNYLVQSGQARDLVDAEKVLNNYVMKGRQKKFGNLERSRELNLPFYDINPDRVLPKYFEGVYHRFEGIKQFGLNNEVKDQLVNGIREDGGDYKSALTAFERYFGTEPQRDAFNAISPKVSERIRNFETITKLGLSAISNSSQTVNTAIATGIRATAQGIARSFSKEGKEFAIRTGAVLDSTVDDIIRNSTGSPSSWTSRFLRGVGFSQVENMNRIVAANAGRNYIENLTKDLLYRPYDKNIQKAFFEIGLNPQKIIEKNGIDLEQLVKGAQNIVNKTQFRSNVLDLPLFFSSPEGRILTQFKSFAFNQTKFVKDVILKDVARGNLKPLITAVTLMPIVGEGVSDVKSILTGKSRNTKGLSRMVENMAAVGSVGLFSDMVKSAQYGKTAEFLGGPAVSDTSAVVQGLIKAAEGKPKSLVKTTVSSVPVLGQLLRHRMYPTKQSRVHR